MNRRILAPAVLVASVLAVMLLGLSADPPAGGGKASPASTGGTVYYEGLCYPSMSAKLALRVSGVVATRPVKDGDLVKKGQLIAELDSSIEKASLEVSRLKAESNYEVKAARMSASQAEVEMGRFEDLYRREMATKWEYEKAKVEWQISQVRVDYADFQQRLAIQEFKRDETAIRERQLLAPCNGVLHKMLKEVGEAARETESIAELLQLDPLWVELMLPPALRDQVACGQKVSVIFQRKDEQGKIIDKDTRKQEGTIILVDAVDDAASASFRVRIELLNPDGALIAGQTARVHFTPPAAAPVQASRTP